jgi:hypothetical protein
VLELSPGVTPIEFLVPVEGNGFRRYRVQVEAANDLAWNP